MKDKKEVIDILGFGFLGSDDSILELILDGLTKIHFEDSYTNVGNFGNGTPSESIKFSADDKRTYIFEFLQELFNTYKQKDQRIEELEESLADKNFTKEHVDLYAENEMLKKALLNQQNKMAIEKLEELLKWADRESNGDLKYPVPVLIDKINSMIKELKGAEDE